MKRIQSRARTCIASLVVGVLLTISVGSANAQWAVYDYMAQKSRMKEYLETAKRWKDQYDHYKQQLIDFKSLNLMSPQYMDDFPVRQLDYGMKESCPGSEAGISVTSAIEAVVPKMTGNLSAEQTKLCQRIVLAENRKYNDTVMMLKKMAKDQQNFYSKIEVQRMSVGTSQGALAANDNEVNRYLSRVTTDVQYWEARMTAYNNYIESLKWDQDRIAKCALRGCPKGFMDQIIGNVVEASTLAAALKINE